MSRFTFAKGNVRKVVALPIYGLGALVSAVVPRQRDHWAFGCGSGVGEGALALYREARAANPHLTLTWLSRNARDAADAARLGIRSVPVSSWRGYWVTLRAQVLVVTHGFGDVNRFATRGAFIVQLWHGIPLKLIHLDSAATMRVPVLSNSRLLRAALRALYRGAARAISLMPAASEVSAVRLRSAFALPRERVVVTGDPRDDVLSEGTAADRMAQARARLAERLGLATLSPHVLLLAPTWRDGASDPGVPTPDEWRAIAAHLAHTDSALVIRPHPLGVGDYSAGPALSDRIHLLTSDLQPDVTPLLPAAGVLITDYSSIAYDFALTGGDILFLAPDVAAYTASRGLYEPYSTFSGGRETASWAQLLAQLDRRENDPAFRTVLHEHVETLASRNHAYRDGRNTFRVYTQIVSRLKGTMTPQPPAPAQGPAATTARNTSGTNTNPAAANPAVTHTILPEPTVTSLVVGSEPAPILHLAGTLGGSPATSVVLVGARLHLAAQLTTDGDTWSAGVPLLASRWGSSPMPPPSGVYRVELRTADVAAPATPRAAGPLPHAQLVPRLFRIEPQAGAGDTLQLEFSAPLTDGERGASRQARLEAAYRKRRDAPLNAVFFESFYGQFATCNPLAIDRAIARLRPDVARYWSVADASVVVPDGATALIDGSEEWWRIRGSARLLVVNDWLRRRYRSRRHQTVLQTWHGTPLKRIALTRPGLRPRAAIATLLERSRWDILLAQNPYSARVFRTAYAYLARPWQEGYPRNDLLAPGDGAAQIASAQRRKALRANLGIAPDDTVVLYAPTWRDDRPEDVDQLDVAGFSRELGPGYVTLIRGHSRSLGAASDVHASRVIDVTSYPDATELFLVSDALVTDYSSVMFDYTVTGKPLYFFTPDLDRYRDELRGFYFDLLAVSPGPVVRTSRELIAHIQNPDAATATYADRYAAWTKRFNPRDDGGAADRVVRRLVANGILD